MSKKAKHPNVNVTFYDGVSDIICECPGELCKFARFYFDPPGPDDECIYCRTGRACTSASAVGAAIAATIKMLQEAKAEVES